MKKKVVLIICAMLLMTGCGKDVKLVNGENAIVTFKEGGISSNELYDVLKETHGAEKIMNLIDEYLLEQIYDETDEEKNYIKQNVKSVKDAASEMGASYEMYLSYYYGVSSDEAFEDYLRLSYRRDNWTRDYAKETITHKFIASMHNVSNKTVQRQINKVYDNEKLYKHSLSENLCFDEFTYKKGVMAFNFCDADTGKTIDLVEDRTTENLNKYFGYYSFESRSRVKNIVIDMYKPYITVIKVNFPNASIIIDPFHITQLISKSMNKTRIKIMKKSKEHYRKFKRYWRLFLKSRLDLDSSCWRKYRCFKNLMTEVDVVDFLLNLDDELKATYNLYQNILYSLQHKDYELFKTIIEQSYNNISSLMQTSLNTLREFSPYIKNTLSTKYSNGIMERNNNTCKLVKRIGFGFRNFRNFKARIMIITNLFRTNKRSTEFSLSTP